MKMRPHIMLQGGVAEEAVALWQRAFAGLHVERPETPALLWRITLDDQTFTLLDSPIAHEFGPTPAWSFMMDVDEAADVDAAAAVLSEGGAVLMPADTYDFATRFAWVEDRFKISWQLRFEATA